MLRIAGCLWCAVLAMAMDRAAIDTAAVVAWPEPWATDRADPKWAGDLGALLLTTAALPAAAEAARAAAEHTRRLDDATTIDDATAQALFARLLAALPAGAWPSSWTPHLAVVDDSQAWIATDGAGLLRCSSGFLATRSEAAQAYGMAHHLALGLLGHTRRGWLWAVAQDERWQPLVAQPALLGLGTAPAEAGHAPFTFRPWQCMAADRYAEHLLTLAAIDVAAGRDHLRLLGADGQRRLARVLARDAGRVPNPTAYGLRRMTADGWAPIADGALAGTQPLLVIHGLNGHLDQLRPVARALAAASDRPLVGLAWPDDIDLASASALLRNEWQRCAAGPPSVAAHSAGGLLVRHAVELGGFEIERALFLATPHGGSDLARLAMLTELVQFLQAGRHGLAAALETVRLDGREELAEDLTPESPFLALLATGDAPLERYGVVRGKALHPLAGMGLATAQALIQDLAQRELERLPASVEADVARRFLAAARLPDEILAGDLAVSWQRAGLPGAAWHGTIRKHHEALLQDPTVAAAAVAWPVAGQVP